MKDVKKTRITITINPDLLNDVQALAGAYDNSVSWASSFLMILGFMHYNALMNGGIDHGKITIVNGSGSVDKGIQDAGKTS